MSWCSNSLKHSLAFNGVEVLLAIVETPFKNFSYL